MAASLGPLAARVIACHPKSHRAYHAEEVASAFRRYAPTEVVPEVADAAVVNSCTVTHVGEGKMRALVRRLGAAGIDARGVVGVRADVRPDVRERVRPVVAEPRAHIGRTRTAAGRRLSTIHM